MQLKTGTSSKSHEDYPDGVKLVKLQLQVDENKE